MKTVIASLIGIYLLVSDIFINGIEEHLMENHIVWGGAVICVLIAACIALWNMDWDDMGPRIMVIVLAIMVAVDGAARLIGFIFSGNLFTSGILKPNLGWLSIVPVILFFIEPFKENESSKSKADPEEEKLDRQIMFAGMVLTALLTFAILIGNAASNDDNFMLAAIMEGLLGVSEKNPPTIFNFWNWSFRLKLIGILDMIFIILSFVKDTKRNPRKLVANIYDNGIFYGLSISIVYWFVMAREHVVIPLAESHPFGLIYFIVFFAELIFTVGFGIALFFLPVFAVGSILPGTTATILKGANDMMNGVFDSAEADYAEDRNKEETAKEDDYRGVYDLNRLPDCMKDGNGTWWYRNHVGNPGAYETLDRKREIQIYSATISKNSAHTDKGMFYW